MSHHNQQPREGWADDITKGRAKTHYYKDGKSLCGKATDNFRLRYFEMRIGSKYAHDCGACINKIRSSLREAIQKAFNEK